MFAPTHNTATSDKPTAAPPAPILDFPTMYGQKKGKHLQATPKLAPQPNVKAAEQPTTVPGPALVSSPIGDSSEADETDVAQLQQANGEAVNKGISAAVQQQDDTHYLNQPTDKFRELANRPLQERLALLRGPTIDVNCGAARFEVPISLLMAVSTTACDKCNKRKLTTLEVDPLLIAGVTRLLDWLRTSLAKYCPYGLQSVGSDAQSLATDNDVVLAGEALGMHDIVRKLRGCWWQWLKFTNVEEIGLDRLQVLEDRISDNFVSTIALMVIDDRVFPFVDGQIKEPARTQFLHWLSQLPKMRGRFFTKVNQIEQQRTTALRKQDEWKKNKEHAHQLRKKQLARDREMRAAAEAKLDRGGVTLLTPAEARTLGRHGMGA
ncbi:uncharacterized protein N0V89_001358 [Didymosphaeria variabile]|uniref:Uncharacterized protein n=1 Tax=Didymosphaeria variabile TaxID=1932322 RepID=A0A9W8XX23_9PLEO|nr:uncharacterized protein N0V89_001358 [Didymosphaeria variabile]KAJ4360791.1 hypothetical protein N0V89_001358 [Didymosphaeria variabile]